MARKKKLRTGKAKASNHKRVKAEVFKKKKKIERVPTGVKGFDKLIEGGVPRNTMVLLVGPCGTGKSIFSMNFLVEGAKKREPGLFVSLEEQQQSNYVNWMRFGWDLESLVKKKKLLITEPELYDFERLLTHIEDNALKIGAKRLVIDSAALIGNYFQDSFKLRQAMIDLEKLMEKIECTAIIIDEVPEHSNSVSTYGVEEYVADGVIVLYAVRQNNVVNRALAIRKMYGTKHSLKVHPFKIAMPGGLKVFSNRKLSGQF